MSPKASEGTSFLVKDEKNPMMVLHGKAASVPQPQGCQIFSLPAYPCRQAAVSQKQHATGLSVSLGSWDLPALQSKGLFNKALGTRAAARWFRRRVIEEKKNVS